MRKLSNLHLDKKKPLRIRWSKMGGGATGENTVVVDFSVNKLIATWLQLSWPLSGSKAYCPLPYSGDIGIMIG
ncbi:MAG: hypothetical protein RML10_11775 [Geminocystis sp.]|nr:hypothetical protein [Geminocystis sp.]MDW8464229.1 hypothetical protein [Geminocystis sp.]HIK36661.1 hypothetical protein [Geminocystis sp. M7585_C2015_104]